MTLDDLKPFIDWMQANPHWAGFATFIISIAESLAVVGLLIPGTIVMGAIGSLVGSGILPSLDIVLWASAGAIVGDGISYWLGYHYHGHIREMWPFRSMPNLMKKGEIFFLRHGGKSVFMGRFIGPIRPIIPVIAGMMNMPPWRFTLANIGSAITWAPAYMLPGYVLGALSLQLAPHTAGRFLVMLIIFLFSLWILYWLSKHILRLVLHWSNQAIHRLWCNLQQNPTHNNFWAPLSHPERATDHSQFTLFLLALLALNLFIATSILATSDIYHAGINADLWHLARNLRITPLDYLFTGFVVFSELPVLYTISSLILVWLIVQRAKRTALHWVLLSLAVTLCAGLCQVSLKVPQPGGLPLSLPGWAYPSLQIALSVTIYGFLAVILYQTSSNRTVYGWIATLLISLTSLARLYLGAAWSTDIVGGLLLGITSLLFFTLSYRSKRIEPITHSRLAITALLVLFIPWGSYSYYYLPNLLSHYTLNENDEVLLPSSPQHYRHNLIGKPAELLNVYWLGSLETIQQTLFQQGWHFVPKPNLAIILNRIAAKNRAEQLPVFPKLYRHKRPDLIMTKLMPEQKKMLVLRLWKIELSPTNESIPLWLGTVAYHKPWQLHFFNQAMTLHDENDYDYADAIQQLIHDTPNFTSSKIPVSASLCLPLKTKGCSPFILQIQTK